MQKMRFVNQEGCFPVVQGLFPIDLPDLKWLEFPAEGYPESVPGVIFRAGQASCGVPLGGIGTGCIDLDTEGTLGRCSIFNSFVPPRVLDTPFVALKADDQFWALTTRAVPGIHSAKQIQYWGHYPVADLEFELAGPLSCGLRAWSPFIPGEAQISNTPAACFEFHLRNRTDSSVQASLVFTFPGPTEEESGCRQYRRRSLTGPLRGTCVVEEHGWGYALGVLGNLEPRTGGPLESNGPEWANLPTGLAAINASQAGLSLATDTEVGPGEEKIIRIVLAWYCPRWAGSAAHHYWHAYRKRFAGLEEVAEFLARHHAELLSRIIRWQVAIYGLPGLPTWLRDQLVNILHTIAEDSFWAGEAVSPQEWYGSTGIFGLTESPRTTPHICNPSDWYGNLPIVFFFPELAAALLRAYAHYQLPNGEIPLGIGEGADLDDPTYQVIHTLNSCVHVHLIDRLWQRNLSQEVLREFYPSVIQALNYTKRLDRDGDGLIDLDPDPIPNQYYGAWFWYGASVHVNGLWLAALAIAERMAEHMKDTAASGDFGLLRAKANQSLEEKLWGGEYYWLYNDPQNGRTSKTVLANQLAGEWCAQLHGLPSIFPEDHILKTLETVKRLCMPLTSAGVLDAARPEGGLDHTGSPQSDGIFVGECACVAATLSYHGDDASGLEIARRLFETIVLKERRPWDMPNILDASGKIIHGTDFYQDMILWALPLASARKSIHQACSAGLMVSRILDAASSSV
jgi:uncharacterized protein (DUF608 family)